MRRAAPFFGAQTCLFFKIFEKSGLKPPVWRSSFRNPHSSDCRRVQYRWHPLHDQEVIICGSRREANGLVHHCRRICDPVGSACLQIPAWMFDAAQCSVSRLESVPRVSLVALVQLRQLLMDTIIASPIAGGTDATRPPTVRDSNGIVSTTLGAAGMEGSTKRDETDRAPVARRIARKSRHKAEHTRATGEER